MAKKTPAPIRGAIVPVHARSDQQVDIHWRKVDGSQELETLRFHPSRGELLGYARLLELCAEFGILETDQLKHQLEDWQRWTRDMKAGRLVEREP